MWRKKKRDKSASFDVVYDADMEDCFRASLSVNFFTHTTEYSRGLLLTFGVQSLRNNVFPSFYKTKKS